MRLTLYWLLTVLIGVAVADTVEDVTKFLNTGDENIVLNDDYRDVTLLVGKTGSGKSTLTLFLTGDLTDLEAVDRNGLGIQTKKEGIIGGSDTVSYTIYPTLYLDELDLAYYDCPGWDDTRNSTFEIAATYFIKRVVDYATSVKILLVVNGYSVTEAQSKTELRSLIQDVEHFVKDLDRYKDSIAMVVTKVHYVVDLNGVPASPTMPGLLISPDNVMIQNIAQFLGDFRLELEKDAMNNRRSIDLLDILLKSPDNGTSYERIAIFRAPITAGPLNTNQWYIDERAALRNMLTNNLVYTERRAGDFGYTISDKSKLQVYQMYDAINDDIVNEIKRIGMYIQQQYDVNDDTNSTLYAFNPSAAIERYNEALHHLTGVIANAAQLTMPIFVERLRAATRALKIKIPQTAFDNLETHQRHVDFLEALLNAAPITGSLAWSNAFKICLQTIEKNRAWYQFLEGLYNEYTKYEFRERIADMKVPQIDADNFDTFAASQHNGMWVYGYQPNAHQLTVLNKFLNLMLKEKQVAKCNGATLVVSGEFVRLSDIDVTLCGKSMQRLHIFALDTVYIDQSIEAYAKKWEIVIIAPKWNVFGSSVVIDLSGAIGESYAKPAATSEMSVKSGDKGLPGRNGGNGGHFLGIGQYFKHADKLKVFGK